MVQVPLDLQVPEDSLGQLEPLDSQEVPDQWGQEVHLETVELMGALDPLDSLALLEHVERLVCLEAMDALEVLEVLDLEEQLELQVCIYITISSVSLLDSTKCST